MGAVVIRVEEFPDEEEFPEVLAAFPAEVVGYWHDFGHAQIRHNLTFLDHAEWLSEMSSHLIGCHVHDVLFPYSDHHVPFSGTINFATLLASIPSSAPLVWELSPRASKEEIVSALARWKQDFGVFNHSPF